MRSLTILAVQTQRGNLCVHVCSYVFTGKDGIFLFYLYLFHNKLFS